MKKGILAVVLAVAFVLVVGFSTTKVTSDTEANNEQSTEESNQQSKEKKTEEQEKDQKTKKQEKINKIFDNGIESFVEFYENKLSESNRDYLLQRPEMLEEVFRNPRFVLKLDNALMELTKVDNKDIKYLYTHDDVHFKIREPEPTSKVKLNMELISKLENN